MEIHLLRGGDRALTLNRRRELQIWDSSPFPAVLLQPESNADIGSIAVAVQPPLLFFGTPKRGIEVWDASSLQPIRQVDAAEFGFWVGALAVSPDSQFLAAGCGAQIVLFNLKSGTVVSRIDATEAISPLLFSPDGTLLVAGMTGQGGTGVQTFRVVDNGLETLVETLDSARRLDSAGDVILSASFSRDGRYLAVFASPPWEDSTADSMGEVFLYDVSTWSLLWHVVLNGSFSGMTTGRDKFRLSDGTDIAWAPDDEHVICGGDNGTLFVLRAGDGSLRRRVALPIEHRIVTFAIDHDNRLLWTANRDSLLKVALDEIVA